MVNRRKSCLMQQLLGDKLDTSVHLLPRAFSGAPSPNIDQDGSHLRGSVNGLQHLVDLADSVMEVAMPTIQPSHMIDKTPRKLSNSVKKLHICES